MGKQHKRLKNDAIEIVPEERKYIYGNNPTGKFANEEIAAFVELGEILRQIHCRLISEGYTIIDGKIKKPDIIEF